MWGLVDDQTMTELFEIANQDDEDFTDEEHDDAGPLPELEAKTKG